MQTILHGKSFFLCDDHGDLVSGSDGLFAHDARHLSRWHIRIDGRRPQPLGAPQGPHFQRSFVQRNLKGKVLPPDSLVVNRRYVVDDALYLRLTIENLTSDALAFDVTADAAADFATIFEVKRMTFDELGDDPGDIAVSDLHKLVPRHPDETTAGAVLVPESGDARTFINATKAFKIIDGGVLSWDVRLASRARWTCDIRISWAPLGDESPIEFDRHRSHVEEDMALWLAQTPMIVAGPVRVRHVYRTSVNDLAALRIHHDLSLDGDASGIDTSERQASMLPAAGLPWFMTTFGRDSLICCLQAVVLGPHRARNAFEYLASLQSDGDNPRVDAEPGKILHEMREGEIADEGYDVYFGSIDSTPLFLMLFDEIHRWTLDDDFARQYRSHAMRALEWIERWGDLDGDGYLEYQRRSANGLANQSWKDSWDSQRFHDGRLAEGAIAPAEVQAYAYEARLRLARVARHAWKDRALATRLERDAAALKQRFNVDFWIPAERVTPIGPDDPRRDGYFALALDGNKQAVDSLCSNIGHLLWCGIVDHDKIDAVVRQLHSRHLYNGWGIRTMSTLDEAYNPIAYHNGTVWPHDTSICVAGLIRAGAYDVAARIAHAMFDAAVEFSGRLPEVFAGLDRSETGHPVEYPTTCSPQAWAAAAPVYMLAQLIGVAPHPKERALTLRSSEVPRWLDGLDWRGIPAYHSTWDVSVQHGIPVIQRH